MKLSCPICNSSSIEGLFEIKDFPLFLHPVSNSQYTEIKEKYPTKTKLAYATCKSCGCIFMTQENDEIQNTLNNIYSRFYNHPSPLKDGITREGGDEMYELIKDKLAGGPKKILEIGCYDGYLLDLLKKDGHDVVGCDPSIGADIGKEFGLNIMKTFFKPGLFEKESFDVVIFRNLIEHIESPVEFLDSVSEIIKPGGLVIIETPNVEYYLKEGILGPFHIEHVILFYNELMKKCIEAAGFTDVKVDETPLDLIAFGKKGDVTEPAKIEISSGDLEQILKYCNEFRDTFIKNKNDVSEFLTKCKEENKEIAMWGAGSASVQFITTHPEIKSKYLVDNDSKKWGGRYISADVVIVPPKTIESDPPDVLLINSQFYKEILEQVKRMNPQFEIWTSFPKLKRLL